MKLKTLLLIQDVRGEQKVYYKEFVGHKLFIKQPKGFANGQAQTKFKRKLNLYEPATQQYRKQIVMCEVISVEDKYLVIGVK